MANFVNSRYLDRVTVDYEPPDQHYIADEILTLVPVTQVSGKIATFAKFPSKQSDDAMGIKSGSSKLNTGRIKSDGTFATEAHGHFDTVTNREAEVYADFTNLFEDTAYELKKQCLLNKEIAAAALVAAGSYGTSPTVKWDASTGTIIIEKDIRNAIAAFSLQAGVDPNTLVIPKEVWDAIVMDSTLRNVWLLVPGRSDQNIKLSSLMKLLFDNFTSILVPNVKKDTAIKGVAESLTPVWTDTVSLLYRVPKGTTKTFTWGGCYRKQDWKTRQWVNDNPEGTNIEVSREEDMKQVCATALYNLTNVLT